ncbi:class F sortase [Kocuria tytonis]|uniref:Class F sortase n=1 Tax=Kocuria tytonis TaxID=2054280 RepID=A0A495A7U5_9MICC|nr:class F sortase [Kocuria tytonis]RKQ35436.1 class F sortase [Kocuria tytonis]
MTTRSRRDHWARLLAGPMVAVALLTSGCASDTASTQATTAPGPATAPTTPPASPKALRKPEVMARSEPVSLDIAATGTHSRLLSLGLKPDGSLEVPPTAPGAPAGWYDGSPTPGERGPAVLMGHVNATDGGAGVFADIKSLHSGDTIEVTRRDASAAVFVVQRGESYSKNDFPSQTVYGNTDDAQLRLITCDGYDPETGLFADNYVVYATLRRAH